MIESFKTLSMTQSSMTYKPKYKYLPPAGVSVFTPLYDFGCTITGLGKRFKTKVLSATLLSDSMVVADIGCGTGVFLKIAKQKYPRVQFVGLDPDKQALAIAERRLTKAGLSVELREAFAESLPLESQSVDVCFSMLAFHHMPDKVKHKAVQEMYRVLKPAGVAIIADFGETKSVLFRKILFFERPEYLEGNLKGLIPQYLKEVGFKIPEIISSHFPGIMIMRAQK